MLYIGWVAARREGGAIEKEWRSAFLEAAPTHALAADVYFSSAIDLLAASQYDEAQRLLEFIELRFPTAKVTARAREIRSRLASTKIEPTTQSIRISQPPMSVP